MKEFENFVSFVLSDKANREIKFGSVFKVDTLPSTMATYDIMNLINEFINKVGKENILLEYGDPNSTPPSMKKELPYIIIEGSDIAIKRAVKKLLVRKYISLIEPDINLDQVRLALMIFKIQI